MRNWLTFILLGICLAGCAGDQVNAESAAKLDSLSESILTLEKGFESGDITAAQFLDTLKKIKGEIKAVKDSNLSASEILGYGGLGGIGGRTAIHVLRAGLTFIPGPIGLVLSTLLGGLLGGSGGGGRKES